MRHLKAVKTEGRFTRERTGEELFRDLYRQAYPEEFKPKLYVVKTYKDRTVKYAK